MSDIFVSYNHEDQLRAQELAQALGGRGWSIFWDRTIPYGKTWRDTIRRELSEARCVIVLWSKTSVESEWVREEADDARQRRVLVPVLIDNIQPPIGFRGIQTANLANWNPAESAPAFDRLAADVAAVLRPAAEESKEQGRQVDARTSPATQFTVDVLPLFQESEDRLKTDQTRRGPKLLVGLLLGTCASIAPIFVLYQILQQQILSETMTALIHC
jgi:hypothetical protein